jgi:CRP-like cAMP-binding protein
MLSDISGQCLRRNSLLARLSAEELDGAAPHFHRTTFVPRQVIQEAMTPVEDVYLPEQGTLSLMADTADGARVEICVVGAEGMVGTESLLESSRLPLLQTVVQLPGSAFRVRGSVFRRVVDRFPTLRGACREYFLRQMTIIGQVAACNARHVFTERFARWLLSVYDKVEGDELRLTHDVIAQLFGTQRTRVTVAASELERCGAIEVTRGRVRLVDRTILERKSCGCYARMREVFFPVLGREIGRSRSAFVGSDASDEAFPVCN